MSESKSDDRPPSLDDGSRVEAELIGRIIQSEQKLESRFSEFLDQERMYSSFTNYLLYLSDRALLRTS